MATIKTIALELKVLADDYNNKLRSAQREAREFEKTIKPVTTALNDLSRTMTSAGRVLTVGLTAPIAAIAGVGVAFNAMKEQAQTAFTTMLGSGQKATVFLEDLKNFAARTPFEFPDLVRASQRLMAMGFAAKDVKPLLSSVGDAVAGLGGGAAEIDRVTLALGQMQGRGRVATQEMNQLTEVGIPAWKILADGIGVTEAKLRDMVEKGAVPAGKSIDVLVAGMTRQFGGMMDKQADSFNGLISTIKDESRFLAGELTEGLFGAIKGPTKAFADMLHNIRESTSGWSDETKAAVTVLGGLTAAAGPALLITGTLAGSVNNLMLAYKALQPVLATSQLSFASIGAALTGPIGITVGLAAAGAALLYFVSQNEESRKAIDKAWVGIKESTKEATSDIGKAWDAAVGSIAQAIDSPAGQKVSEFLAQFTAAAIGSIGKNIENHIKYVGDAIDVPLQFVPGKLSAAELQQPFQAARSAGLLGANMTAAIEKSASDSARAYAEFMKPIQEKASKAASEFATANLAATVNWTSGGTKVLQDYSDRFIKNQADLYNTNQKLMDEDEEAFAKFQDLKAKAFAGSAAMMLEEDQKYRAGLTAGMDELGNEFSSSNVQRYMSTTKLLNDLTKEEERAAAARQQLVATSSAYITGVLKSDALTAGNAIKSVFESVHEGALTFGNVLKGIGAQITGSFLGPIKSAIDSFFQGLMDTTVNKVARDIGAKIGGAITDALTQSGGGSMGSNGNTRPSGMKGVLGALTNPWTMVGIGGAAAVAGIWKNSQAHWEANEWVQGFQNPFDSSWQQIQGSTADVNERFMLQSELVRNYIETMKQFAGGGKDQKQVAKQALEGFIKYYGSPANFGADVPSFKVGTPYVPKDTLAYLHQGEAVLTREQNQGRRGPEKQPITINITNNVHGADLQDTRGIAEKLARDMVDALNTLTRSMDVGLHANTAAAISSR